MDTSSQPSEVTNIGNTLANGINGQYHFNIKAILKEAWEKTHGIKATYWQAFGLFILIFLGLLISFVIISFCIGLAAGLLHASKPTIDVITDILSMIYLIAYTFPTAPLTAGLLMVGIKHCVGEHVILPARGRWGKG